MRRDALITTPESAFTAIRLLQEFAAARIRAVAKELESRLVVPLMKAQYRDWGLWQRRFVGRRRAKVLRRRGIAVAHWPWVQGKRRWTYWRELAWHQVYHQGVA